MEKPGLLEFLREFPIPGDTVQIGDSARNKNIRGKTGVFVEYVNAIVLVDGRKVNVTPKNIILKQ